MAIFNSYVKLPEGRNDEIHMCYPVGCTDLHRKIQDQIFRPEPEAVESHEP